MAKNKDEIEYPTYDILADMLDETLDDLDVTHNTRGAMNMILAEWLKTEFEEIVPGLPFKGLRDISHAKHIIPKFHKFREKLDAILDKIREIRDSEKDVMKQLEKQKNAYRRVIVELDTRDVPRKEKYQCFVDALWNTLEEFVKDETKNGHKSISLQLASNAFLGEVKRVRREINTIIKEGIEDARAEILEKHPWLEWKTGVDEPRSDT